MEHRQLGLVVVVLAAMLATSGLQAQQPPTELHRVGDHWTAWEPPTDIPAGAEVYTIVPGDTLWDLSGRFYGDSYLWPQLWERNQYIKDAHWIYPGDPLMVSVEVAPAEPVMAEPEEPMAEVEAPAERGPGWATPSLTPEPLGSQDDIYCSGFIGELEEEFGYQIVGSEYEAMTPTLEGRAGVSGKGLYGAQSSTRYNLSLGDIVYVDGGQAAGLSPGLVYTAVEPGPVIRHPETGKVTGRLYSYQGRIRMLTVQPDVAIAEIIQTCGPIYVGSALMPFVPEPVPLGRRTAVRPPNDPVPAAELEGAPVILHAKDGVISLGADQVVYIDRGAEDGVAPGDIYTIFRLHRRGFPPVVLGELAVLSVHSGSSVGKILEAREPVYVGDLLDLK
jgi:hypothetical protein